MDIRMNHLVRAIPALLLATSLMGCAVNKQDEKITTNVRAALATHSDLGPPGAIRVQARENVVYLSGLVNSGYSGENAVAVASQVDGVTNVVSNVSPSK
jgi:osmotically-inducible protein OsmY